MRNFKALAVTVAAMTLIGFASAGGGSYSNVKVHLKPDICSSGDCGSAAAEVVPVIPVVPSGGGSSADSGAADSGEADVVIPSGASVVVIDEDEAAA